MKPKSELDCPDCQAEKINPDPGHPFPPLFPGISKYGGEDERNTLLPKGISVPLQNANIIQLLTSRCMPWWEMGSMGKKS